MNDIVTFGESMMLFTPQKEGLLNHSHLFEKSFGGAESNVAIGLARLGVKVGWFSRLGADPFGEFIINSIRGEGVDVSRVNIDETHPTGVMFKEITGIGNPNVYYYRKHSAASRMTPEDLDEEYIKQAKILHITGITPALSESCYATTIEAIKLAKKHGVKVCFDPNIRLKLLSLEKIRKIILELAMLSDYFLPGIDELTLLFDSNDNNQLIQEVQKLNIPTTIIKLGKDGCMIVNQETIKIIDGLTVEKVVDTVGAGDGFCAGFLYSITNGKSEEEAAEFANAVGAHVIQFKGDVEGLPTKRQIQYFNTNDRKIER
ncbi:sugar kinase [Bacillus pinisoli]|uniref:sugar kinase n=1 Tax=Bacillus pinisoli TaxID=2901866 RepID=UPI001FF19548|nr:sugar kinase [Bacillus pinisoli]